MRPSANKYTVFTSVFGEFEPVWTPLETDAGYSYILVSDVPAAEKVWTTHCVESTRFGSPRLANRFHKMKFHEDLPSDGYSVYIDANIRPVGSLKRLMDAFEASGADIGLYRHYSRGSVQAEAEACVARGKVANPDSMALELRHYQNLGFPDSDGLWEGSIIFKNHSSPMLHAAMDDWWAFYEEFETRDQFSLPVVIWKHGLRVFDLGGATVTDPKPFAHLQHAHTGFRDRLARYLQARAPENLLWAKAHKIAQILNST